MERNNNIDKLINQAFKYAKTITNPEQIYKMPDINSLPVDIRKLKLASFININFPDKTTKIIDVACGFCPHFLEILYEIGYKNVVGMDPITKKNDFAKQIPLDGSSFNENTNISMYDLLISVHGCGLAELMIKRCINENKSFVIVPCDCVRPYYIDELFLLSDKRWDSKTEWLNHLKNLSNSIKHIPDFYSNHSEEEKRLEYNPHLLYTKSKYVN